MVKDIAEQLKSRFSEMGLDVPLEDIESKLDELINKFRVPVDEAKRSVVSQYLKESNIPRGEFYGKDVPLVKVGDISSDGRWIRLKAKVVQLWPSESDSIAQVGLIGDETGAIKFVNWAKSARPLIEEGKSYIFKNVVTDSWQGRFQVNFNKNTDIQEIEEDIEVGSSVEDITGAVVDIQSGSGLIKRCESCNRALVKGSCGEHGKVEGKYDLRVKAVIDDGKIVRDAILNREITEKLTGITLDTAKKMAEETLDPSKVADAITEQLMGRYFKIKGPRVGRYILVETMEKVAPVLEEEIQETIAMVEGL